ncbi:MAG: paraquat-inducible protein A [Burkholderiaceae bacterium]|nr:paraquat-inducible protein A [Burkholderiaceae bacterium]
MHEVANVIACEGCDALYPRSPLRPHEVARCSRCGTELERHPGRQAQWLLPVTLAAVLLFVIANAYPIAELQLRGTATRTTLLGTVLALGADGREVVALLVLVTTILCPLLQLAGLSYLFAWPRLQVWSGKRRPIEAWRTRPAGFDRLARAIRRSRPWAMIEVFLLGVLIAMVKLASMAAVIPGIALWAFGALTIALTATLSFDPRRLWQRGAPVQPADDRPGHAGQLDASDGMTAAR